MIMSDLNDETANGPSGIVIKYNTQLVRANFKYTHKEGQG